MPPLLQPRLSCFYCGSRSSYAKDGKTRQFTCQKCDATNYLDHKGDIADPPTTPAKPQTASFAHAPLRSSSPPGTTQGEDSLFCKACLKNQHFLTTCLAEYLPSEDDPEYEKYERQYPQYRKDLERRYPQVCPQCAPRVQERIRKTGYAAKVDFLTKSIERSKARPLSSPTAAPSFLALLLNLVMLAWWASLLLQAVWHTLRLLAIPADQEQVANMKPLMLVGCTMNAAQNHYLPPGCSHLFTDTVGKSIRLNLLLAWWNPAIKTKLQSPGRNYQWRGLSDFYRFQTLILVVRTIAWLKLSDPYSQSSTTQITRALHGFALLFTLIGALASQRMVSYTPAPRFSFRDTTGSLVEPDSFQYPADTPAQPLSHPLSNSLRQTTAKPFDISNFGPRRHFEPPAPVSPASTIAAPLTPPESDVDAADSMDWEPLPRYSSPILRKTHIIPNMTSSFPPAQASSAAPEIPAFLRRPAVTNTVEKSPFAGRLPPAPISPAHRLRNPPPPRHQFKPTPLAKQQDFFKQVGLSFSPNQGEARHTRRRSSGAESNDTVQDDVAEQEDVFRPARWTLQSDLDAAARGTGTGLEDMFSSSFKLGNDTPSSTPRKRPANTQRQQQQRREMTGGAGDGRELLFVNRASAQTAAAAKIVHGNLSSFVVPLVLGLLACAIGMLRDPGAREWVVNVFARSVGKVTGGFGGSGGGGGDG